MTDVTRRKIARKTIIPMPPDFTVVIEKKTKVRYTHALLLEGPKGGALWTVLQLSHDLPRLQRRMRKLEELWLGVRRLWIVEVTQEKPPRRKRPKAARAIGPALSLTKAQLRGVRRVWEAEGKLPYWHLAPATLEVIVARGFVENLSGKLALTTEGLQLLGKETPRPA